MEDIIAIESGDEPELIKYSNKGGKNEKTSKVSWFVRDGA